MATRPGSAKVGRASPPLLRFALAVVAIALAACQGDRTDKKAEAAEIAGDCDDLPALTAEELARPPRDLRLERAAQAAPWETRSYAILPDVTLSDDAAAKISRIDAAFSQRTGEHLVITSGKRDAARQAKAMFKMLELGADIIRLYKNKRAAREIQSAYEVARSRPPEVAIAAMHEVIKGQMARGIYISAHLRSGAVDIRNRTMSAAERQAFVKAVIEVGGVLLLSESKPPHYHLQIE
jgi:hypothetical protein